jgi:hypothetical protein
MLNCPLDNMLISKLAICTNTLPTTCFDTSKNQIFIGRCGLSLHRLYTNAINANSPSAPCTTRAKGPNSRHSPLSGGGVLPSSSEAEIAVAAMVAAVAVRVGMSESIEVAVVITVDRKVGVAFSRREAIVGSKPGGGSMSF